MDVQQLTLAPGGRRSSWSLRAEEALPVLTPWWLDPPAAEREIDEVIVPALGRPGPHPAVRGAAVTAVAGALVLVVAAAMLLLAGCRWFVVETPSMGTTAPVGTLVVTAPTSTVHRGDVIAFDAPAPERVYTHRVVAVAADGGIRTQGDINSGPDPWTLRPEAVLGRAVVVLPGAGFAVRALPLLVGGGLAVQLLTLLVRRPDRRAAARVVGWHLVAAAVLLWLRPLVRIVLVTTEAAADGVHASIVSTGLLPVRLVSAAGDVLARLSDGHPEIVRLPASGPVLAVPDLSPTAQVVLVGIAALPALGVLLVGLPRNPRTPA